MKRLLLGICCLMVMAGPAAAVGLDLTHFSIFFLQGANWDTAGTNYALGVSSSPGGPLISSPLEIGNVYYLYAGNLASFSGSLSPGALTTLDIYSNYVDGGSPRYYRTYTVAGPPGTFQLWNPGDVFDTGGLPHTDIYLGWAQGAADKVDLHSFSPGGGDDIYLALGIGVVPTAQSPVPIPGAVWLLGSGLAGLVGIGRRRFKK